MALVEIGITGNAGYSANQVRKMTVSELISELENFDSKDEIYLKDAGNRYGAAYGQINYIEQGLSEVDEDDEDEYYESNLYSMIKSNLKESNVVDETCLEPLRLIHDDMNMISAMEDDELKFKIADIDFMIDTALDIKENAEKLVNALREVKKK